MEAVIGIIIFMKVIPKLNLLTLLMPMEFTMKKPINNNMAAITPFWVSSPLKLIKPPIMKFRYVSAAMVSRGGVETYPINKDHPFSAVVSFPWVYFGKTAAASAVGILKDSFA